MLTNSYCLVAIGGSENFYRYWIHAHSRTQVSGKETKSFKLTKKYVYFYET